MNTEDRRQLAYVELIMLMKLHSSHLYNWANTRGVDATPTIDTKQALLDVTSRLYEVIEALPLKEPKPQ